jgi:hypothetical protein
VHGVAAAGRGDRRRCACVAMRSGTSGGTSRICPADARVRPHAVPRACAPLIAIYLFEHIKTAYESVAGLFIRGQAEYVSQEPALRRQRAVSRKAQHITGGFSRVVYGSLYPTASG